MLTPKKREEILDKFAKYKLLVYDLAEEKEIMNNYYNTKQEAKEAFERFKEGHPNYEEEWEWDIMKTYIVFDDNIITETEKAKDEEFEGIIRSVSKSWDSDYYGDIALDHVMKELRTNLKEAKAK